MQQSSANRKPSRNTSSSSITNQAAHTIVHPSFYTLPPSDMKSDRHWLRKGRNPAASLIQFHISWLTPLKDIASPIFNIEDHNSSKVTSKSPYVNSIEARLVLETARRLKAAERHSRTHSGRPVWTSDAVLVVFHSNNHHGTTRLGIDFLGQMSCLHRLVANIGGLSLLLQPFPRFAPVLL